MMFPREHDYYKHYWNKVDERKRINDERREAKKKKVIALLDDPAATEGEKQAAREILKKLEEIA